MRIHQITDRALETLEKLRDTAAFREAEAREQQTIAAQREEASEARKRLVAGRGKEAERLTQAVVVARKEVDALEAELAKKRAALEDAERANWNAGNAYDRELLRLEAQLRANVATAVVEFRAWIAEAIEALQRAPLYGIFAPLRVGAGHQKAVNRSEQVHDALRALFEIREELEREAMFEGAGKPLAAAIAKLRAKATSAMAGVPELEAPPPPPERDAWKEWWASRGVIPAGEGPSAA